MRKQIDLDDSDDSSDSSDDDNDKKSTKSDPAKFLVGFAFASMLALEGADILHKDVRIQPHPIFYLHRE